MRVVFCTYLAAMWPSLSPLYDEHVALGDEVIVMPLPYYVRDYTGTPIKRFVDCTFPVKVTAPDFHYLENLLPDRIYFHNPYDDRNRITMIDPEFFSTKLAQCTHDLVYVPYYTFPFGDDLDSIIMAPGVRVADRIIVWDEKSKRSYIDTLSRLVQKDWSSIITVNDRPVPPIHYSMPKDWKRIAKGRRLIFFNTSVVPLIQDGPHEIRKIHETIAAYQNNDVCLLWRPHPLFEAAVMAIHPELRRAYYRTVDDFKRNRLGIFDTSSDLERAVALSFYYVGDPSSVAIFFEKQNKPVRII